MCCGKSLLDLCKIWDDAELIYNLSDFSTCDILYLLRSDWINLEIIQFLHPPVILFLLLIGLIYFGMYFISEVSLINTFTSTVIAQIKHPHKFVRLYHCVALVMIFEADFSFLQEYH